MAHSQHGHPWLDAIGVITAGITAYYMFRLLFVAFLGEYRGDAHIHTGGPRAWIMNVPVAILVVPTVAIGGALLFGGDASPWAHFFASALCRAGARCGERKSRAGALRKPHRADGAGGRAIGIRDRVAALCDRQRRSAMQRRDSSARPRACRRS